MRVMCSFVDGKMSTLLQCSTAATVVYVLYALPVLRLKAGSLPCTFLVHGGVLIIREHGIFSLAVSTESLNSNSSNKSYGIYHVHGHGSGRTWSI